MPSTDRRLGRGESVEDGECDRLLVQRTQERPACSDVHPVGDQVGVLSWINGQVTDVGETDRESIVPGVPAPGVLEGLACHAEEPGARRRQVVRDIVETAPRDEHDLTDHVLGVGRGGRACARSGAGRRTPRRTSHGSAVRVPAAMEGWDPYLFLSESAPVCRARRQLFVRVWWACLTDVVARTSPRPCRKARTVGPGPGPTTLAVVRSGCCAGTSTGPAPRRWPATEGRSGTARTRPGEDCHDTHRRTYDADPRGVVMSAAPDKRAPGAGPARAWLPPRWFVVLFWHGHRALLRATRGRVGLWRPKPGGWGRCGSPRRADAPGCHGRSSSATSRTVPTWSRWR